LQYLKIQWFNTVVSVPTHHAMKAYKGNRGTVPNSLHHGTKWKWVVRSAFQSLIQVSKKSLWTCWKQVIVNVLMVTISVGSGPTGL